MKKYIEDYVSFKHDFCGKCEELSVEEFILEDGSIIHICNKCGYCPETKSYQILSKQIEGVNDTKNCFVGYKAYVEVPNE